MNVPAFKSLLINTNFGHLPLPSHRFSNGRRRKADQLPFDTHHIVHDLTSIFPFILSSSPAKILQLPHCVFLKPQSLHKRNSQEGTSTKSRVQYSSLRSVITYLEQVHQQKATRNISWHLLKQTRAVILFPACVLFVPTILYYGLHQPNVLEISFESQQVEGKTDTSHLSSNKHTKRIQVNWGHPVFASLKQSRVSVQLHRSGFLFSCKRILRSNWQLYLGLMVLPEP